MKSGHPFLRVGIVVVGAILLGLLKWSEYAANSPPSIEANPTGRLPNGELPVLWNAPDFAAIDQNERPVTEKDLRGHVWVADFIFTHCTSACPLMTAKMILLQRAVHAPDVRFVSFSIDPDRDTPAVLKQYAALWNRDESRWLLLNTDRKMLYHTAAGMKVAVMPTDDQDVILHSNLFFLVDQQGQVRSVSDSNDDAAMKQLAADAAMLARGSIPPPPTVVATDDPRARDGEKLFAPLGCAACHNQAQLAPPVSGLFGHSVTLDDGRMVPAGEAYLRESLLDPGAKIVAGYLHLMPSYREHLTDEQVEQLVAYMRSVGNSFAEGAVIALAAAPQPAGHFVVTDPVCKMKVRTGQNALHAEYQGKTYYFCGDHCRVVFAKNPEKYATP
jgi:protein SCO1/2